MVNWISWNDIHDEKMKDPVYKAEFDKGYAEFHRQNAAELAAERVAAMSPRFILAAHKPKRKPCTPTARIKQAVA